MVARSRLTHTQYMYYPQTKSANRRIALYRNLGRIYISETILVVLVCRLWFHGPRLRSTGIMLRGDLFNLFNPVCSERTREFSSFFPDPEYILQGSVAGWHERVASHVPLLHRESFGNLLLITKRKQHATHHRRHSILSDR